ncbi:MAG: hypothetical protein ACLPM3_12370 [Terracidiphilus sp.]
MLTLLLVLAALSGVPLPAQQCSGGWQVKIQVNGALRFCLRSYPVHGITILDFSLQILEGSGHSLVLLEIGEIRLA